MILQFPRTTYRVEPWPRLQISSRTGSGPWRPVPVIGRDAIFNLLTRLRQSDQPHQRLAIYSLLRDLPLWVHARLTPMGGHYWQGVHWLGRLPALLGPLESSPALFAAVVQYLSAGVIREEHHAELETRLRGRQRDLLRWLGLGTAEAHCRIFRRFPRYPFSHAQWRALGRNLAHPELCRALQRKPAVDDADLDFLTDEWVALVLTPNARAEYLDSPPRRLRHDYFGRINCLSFGLLFRRFGLLPAPSPSLKTLIDYIRDHKRLLDDLPLATGPITDLPGMNRILTPWRLATEGTDMGHCVGSVGYLIDGLLGRRCYYHLDRPTPVTIALKRDSSLLWSIDEIKGPKNARVPDETTHAIISSLERTGQMAWRRG